jgi:beta-N-acetylhexosaminidase
MGNNCNDATYDVGTHIWAGFEGLEFNGELERLIREFRVGGIVLFSRNVESPKQIRSLLGATQKCALAALGRPLWVAIDQEGGPVQRLVPPFFTELPSARRVASEGAESIAKWVGVAARELRENGIQVNLAPVLDIAPKEATSFLHERSLGTDAREVARLGRVWIDALQSAGVCATAKHYPGLGRAELDPHHFAPVIQLHDQAEIKEDLLPFKAAIEEGVRCVMTSHARYPRLDSEWPATLSPNICRKLLREELGFQGILLSDDMDMAAISENYSWDTVARQGLLAGIDFFLLCQHPRNIEPFLHALAKAETQDPEAAQASRASFRRIRSFQSLHDLSQS